MASNMLTDLLRQVAIFRDLSPRQLEELARHAERVRFGPGDFVTCAGDAGDGAYVLVSGAAERAPDPGEEGVAERVQPGSIIGQLAMLVEHAYGSTVIARERVFCLKITRAGLNGQMTRDVSLAQHFERNITGHLKAVARQLREIDSLLQARRHATLVRQVPVLQPPRPDGARTA